MHLPSKNYTSDLSQSEEVIPIVEDINNTEFEKNDRHIVIGDFNMNPFETGMIKALGFHATMSSSIASTKSRIIQKWSYKFFL